MSKIQLDNWLCTLKTRAGLRSSNKLPSGEGAATLFQFSDVETWAIKTTSLQNLETTNANMYLQHYCLMNAQAVLPFHL